MGSYSSDKNNICKNEEHRAPGGAQSTEGWKHTDNPRPFYPDTTEFLH